MTFTRPMLLALILVAAPFLRGAETATFRQWIAGQEAGGSIQKNYKTPEGQRQDNHEWTKVERMGTVIEQELKETALKRPDGSLAFTWSLSLSREPLEGSAAWSPKLPGKLKVTFKNGAPRTVDVPADVLLWPGDVEHAIRTAARNGVALKIKGYALPTQQWTTLDLVPVGPAPLPGFPDTFRFKGKASEGSLAEDVDLWISPTQGEVKHVGSLAGIPLMFQRTELPPPPEAGPVAGLFERTLRAVPPHPFLLWLPTVTVHWTGKGVQTLPQDPQQRRDPNGHYVLTRAVVPPGRELPVQGKPLPEDLPFLAATPLAQFRDPVFDGLERRLHAPPGASRWELAKRVTTFVYDWIKDKNYTVGFASAQEVARNAKGDCTEHGVLAVALLRRLGVPARGVTGWIAYGETLGLHFWVEVKIGGRWIPVDPTFDQAPASTYRLKLGTTDLADLGSVGWESATTTFLEGGWAPDGPWAAELQFQGDTARVTDGMVLRLAGSRWSYAQGRLTLTWSGPHTVEAVVRPTAAQLQDARRIQGAGSRRQGWWDSGLHFLWMDLGNGKWLKVDTITESQAFVMLDNLDLGAKN